MGRPAHPLSGAPPLAVAAWRLCISTLLLLPFFAAWSKQAEWKPLAVRERWIALGAGIALALHFAAWITSLRLTSVAASSVLTGFSSRRG